jgi:hypothetical protein
MVGNFHSKPTNKKKNELRIISRFKNYNNSSCGGAEGGRCYKYLLCLALGRVFRQLGI